MPTSNKQKSGLNARHQKVCEDRGVSVATARGNGIYSTATTLVIPYRGLDGKPTGANMTRPDKPRTRDGKPVKYEWSAGKPSLPYFPADSRTELRSGESAIYITEGPLKANALAELGYTAIGINGIWNWKVKGEERLIPELRGDSDSDNNSEGGPRIAWVGRKVYIVFDFDPKSETRQHVLLAAKRLAAQLKAEGVAEVYLVLLPPAEDGGKQGVDDFIVGDRETASERLASLFKQAKAIDGNSVIKIIPPGVPAAARHGLFGKFLDAVARYTEATDLGVLAHLLVALAVLVGPGPYVFAGSRQPARINAILVGPTSKGRKGTAAATVEECMCKAVPEFWNEQRVSGLSSGEGLIEQVSDKKSRDENGELVVEEVEKRLYVIEAEWAKVLSQADRSGNTLSPTLREAYDSGNLATITANSRKAIGAHIGIVGHITLEEVSAKLTALDMANGFANRNLFFYSESDKIITRPTPFPPNLFKPFAKRIRELLALGASGKELPVGLDDDAQSLWEEVYPGLREDRDGLSGALLARGASAVLRLALLYCLVEQWEDAKVAPQIGRAHLEAALAVWTCCEKSVEQMFSARKRDSLGEKLLALLEDGPMTKSELNTHLSEKQKRDAPKALAALVAQGTLRQSERKSKGAGRPARQWELIG